MKKWAVIIAILSLILTSLSLYLYFIRTKGSKNQNAFQIGYLDSSSERFPNKADLSIPKDEDKALLEDILETHLGRGNTLSDEEKSIRILAYVASSLASAPNSGSATKIIRDGFALCGGKSYVFVMLCRKVGIPARYVGSMYMSTLGSHAASEVFYEGRWHLYDATYGMFFYSNHDYDKKGYVISFHDLVSNPDTGTPFRTAPKDPIGQQNMSIEPLAIAKVEGREKNEDAKEVELYRKEVDEGFPIAYGSDDIVSYPVDANLLQESSQWFGQVNGSDHELATYEVRFSGSHYVGNGTPPAFHTWLVKALPYTKINIEYYSTLPDPPKLCLVPLRSARVIESRYEGKKVTFTVCTNDSEAVLSVYCPGNTFSVDAMHICRQQVEVSDSGTHE